MRRSLKSSTNRWVMMSDTELPVRRAEVKAEEELAFVEESAAPLSDRYREHFLLLIANSPAPTPALKKAASRHKARRG